MLLYRASAATTPRDVWLSKARAFLRPLEQRYAPLVVQSSMAWIVPCQQTQKAGQMSQGLLSLVLFLPIQLTIKLHHMENVANGGLIWEADMATPARFERATY